MGVQVADMSDTTTGNRFLREESPLPPFLLLVDKGQGLLQQGIKCPPREPVARHFHEGAGEGLTRCGHQLGIIATVVLLLFNGLHEAGR